MATAGTQRHGGQRLSRLGQVRRLFQPPLCDLPWLCARAAPLGDGPLGTAGARARGAGRRAGLL